METQNQPRPPGYRPRRRRKRQQYAAVRHRLRTALARWQSRRPHHHENGTRT